MYKFDVSKMIQLCSPKFMSKVDNLKRGWQMMFDLLFYSFINRCSPRFRSLHKLSIITWPSGKLTFECKKKPWHFFQKNWQKLSFFQQNCQWQFCWKKWQFLSSFWKKCQVFGNFWHSIGNFPEGQDVSSTSACF